MNDWLKLGFGAFVLVSGFLVMAFRIIPKQDAGEYRNDPSLANLSPLQRKWELLRPWYMYVLAALAGGTLMADAILALQSR